MSDSHEDDVSAPTLGAFQPPLLAAGQAESSDDDDDEAAVAEVGSTRSPQSEPDVLAASSAADEPGEASLLPSAEDALEDDAAGAFLKVSHSVDVPAMEGFTDPDDAGKPSGAEKQRAYTENAAACLAARNQAPSANRKRKPGSEPVDGGHFRSEANARKNAGKATQHAWKRPLGCATARYPGLLRLALLAPGYAVDSMWPEPLSCSGPDARWEAAVRPVGPAEVADAAAFNT